MWIDSTDAKLKNIMDNKIMLIYWLIYNHFQF